MVERARGSWYDWIQVETCADGKRDIPDEPALLHHRDDRVGVSHCEWHCLARGTSTPYYALTTQEGLDAEVEIYMRHHGDSGISIMSSRTGDGIRAAARAQKSRWDL